MARVTNSMLTANYLANMNRNLRNMQTIQSQLSSGKEISRPSDNPYKVSRTMQLYSEMDSNKQFNENIKDVGNWLDTTDTALNQAGNVFARIKELLVSAGNASYGDDERKAIQDEIKQKVNEFSQILNTNFDGAYIFGGSKSLSKPVMVDADGKIQYANKDGKAIDNIYLNVAGDVVNTPISNNNVLTPDDKIYLGSNGKITTTEKSKDGSNNIPIISSNSLYLDADGNITTLSEGNKSIVLKDALYFDLKGNVTTSETTENKLITSDDKLYYYQDSIGNVTTSPISENTMIKTLYKDENGNVTSKITQNQISSTDALYEDADGNIKTSLISNGKINKQIFSLDSLYEKEDGTITTLDTLNDATRNKLIHSPKFLYEDINGNITTMATSKPVASNSTLYLDANGAVTTKTSPMVVPSNADLYLDSSGKVKASAISINKIIPSGKPLYEGIGGRISTLPISKLIKSGDPLYVDIEGNVTTSSTTINNKLSRPLFYDKDNNLTIDAYDKDGNPYSELNPDSNIYIDSKEKLTNSPTSNGIDNKVIVLNDSLYINQDKKNVKALRYGEIIPVISEPVISGHTLYINDKGQLTKLEKNEDNKDNKKIILGDTLYLDSNNNVTTALTTPNKLIKSNDSLYSDLNGNLTTLSTREDGNPNKLITSDDELYQDINGNISTIPSGIKFLLNTGQALYVDNNAKITSSPVTLNKELTTNDKIYVDPAGNTTMLETSTNKKLTMTDITNLSDELKTSSITKERKDEVDKILKNSDAAQLLQLSSGLNVEVSQGVLIDYNITATDILEYKDKTGTSKSIIDVFNNIIKNLNSPSNPTNPGNSSKTTGEDLVQVDAIIQNILQKRSEVGAMTNRMESAQQKNEDENLNMTDILSKTEDIDFTEKMMQYSTMQTIYMAALQTSAKILPATILDYIR